MITDLLELEAQVDQLYALSHDQLTSGDVHGIADTIEVLISFLEDGQLRAPSGLKHVRWLPLQGLIAE